MLQPQVKRKGNNVAVVRFPGNVTMGEPAHVFKLTMEQLIGEERVTNLVLDLSETRLVDSAGLSAMTYALCLLRRRRGDMKLINVSKSVEEKIKAIGLGNLEFFETEGEAIGSFALY